MQQTSTTKWQFFWGGALFHLRCGFFFFRLDFFCFADLANLVTATFKEAVIALFSQVEWRRPSSPHRSSSIPIRRYTLRLRKRQWPSSSSSSPPGEDGGEDVVAVDVMNDTLRNVAFLSNLSSDSLYDLTVSASVDSAVSRGRLYRGPDSLPRRVFVGRECDPHQVQNKLHFATSLISTKKESH